MNKYKVSVIIPSYNRYDTLLRAIDSVKSQTHKNIEIIVINDHSADIRYYENKIDDIVWINLEENSKKVVGKPCVGYVRNFGINRSSGDYIAFLDDDDVWLPNKIEIQLKCMLKHNIDMCCSDGYKMYGVCDLNKIDEKFKFSITDKEYDMSLLKMNDYPEIITRKINKKRNIIYCSSTIVNKSIIKKAGLMKHVRIGKEDYSYWQECLKYTGCYRCNDPLFVYSLR